MTNTQQLTTNDPNPISVIETDENHPSTPNTREKNHQSSIKVTTRTERLKNYFITTDGRINFVEFLFTLVCVIVQHVMGTCHHSIIGGQIIVKWYVFTPPFGAGPHTAVYFFVLSWTTLAYCIERMWIYMTTGVRVSKKRDLIVHGIIASLYTIAFGFNIWGYVLCESASQVNELISFSPGICRGDSQACILLIAGVLTSCAVACAFFAEHVLILTKILQARRETNGVKSTRILP
ncbi:hypothetical protein I4U23_019105 [Adineta vaga]|nr:hypothetical protein I4U23_019105 [Adineta vaga]